MRALALLCLLGTSLAADTYPRQPIDLEHYRFALTLSDTTDRIDGEATIRLQVLKAGVTSVSLDLASATPARDGKGMTVQSVTSAPLGGFVLTFSAVVVIGFSVIASQPAFIARTMYSW